jgi:hypothetical protein
MRFAECLGAGLLASTERQIGKALVLRAPVYPMVATFSVLALRCSVVGKIDTTAIRKLAEIMICRTIPREYTLPTPPEPCVLKRMVSIWAIYCVTDRRERTRGFLND